MGRYFNQGQINREVPITSLLSDYGFETNTKKLIHCVSINHEDKNPSMKIMPRSNSCYCFACNANITPIKLVMEQENKSFYEACEYLVDTYHLSDDCYIEYPDKSERENRKDDFPLSFKELRAIDLLPNRSRIDLQSGNDEKSVLYGIKDYYREDKKGFYDMVYYKSLEKSVEKNTFYKKILSLYKEYKDDLENFLKQDNHGKLILQYETKERSFTQEEKEIISSYLLMKGLVSDMQGELDRLKYEKRLIDDVIKKTESYYSYCKENERVDDFAEKEDIEEYEIV